MSTSPTISVNDFLAAHYAVGPHLPNAFACLAPVLDTVTYSLLVEPDESGEKWDPEWGPKGKSKCYQLDVRVATIAQGREFEAHAYLGNSWDTTDDPRRWIADNCHGYLPQMTQDAVLELLTELVAAGVAPTHPVVQQLQAADQQLCWLMQAIYADQNRLYAMLEKDETGIYNRVKTTFS